MEKEKVFEKIRTYYDNLSDDQLKEKLLKQGFEVIEDGKGELTLVD